MVWKLASLPLLTTWVALLVTCLAVGFWLAFQALQRIACPDALQLLLDLSHDRVLYDSHLQIGEAFKQVAERPDPLFRQLAETRLSTVQADLARLGNGLIEFESTESWRAAYEELLRSPGLHLYRSVAHIESPHYWQDGPGRQSTQLNLELHDQNVINIERTAIIADHLWPKDEQFPIAPVHDWIEQQHRYGIGIRLVRESALKRDPDLLTDFGIYGHRATGIQITDPAGRTIRFCLDFNFSTVQRAETNWKRLAMYADSYSDVLDVNR